MSSTNDNGNPLSNLYDSKQGELLNDSLTPLEIVKRLDAHIIGQDKAKRAVAIAIRNRWRRQRVSEDLRADVAPKNIIMIGPTGVGKTEIARRLAALTDAPFVKVEATKYTEVGYHGRDVESIIRDLAKVAANMCQKRASESVKTYANQNAIERVLDSLLPPMDYYSDRASGRTAPASTTATDNDAEKTLQNKTRDKLRKKLIAGELDNSEIEIEVKASGAPVAGVIGTMGGDEIGVEMQEMLDRMMPSRNKTRKTTVKHALRMIESEETEKLIDQDAIKDEAVRLTENFGIVFIDEIDKVVGSDRTNGPDVSREGVQRDLLPLVEGSQVLTRYGMINTDHILFIAAGAFHHAKPSDLLPELQGRFPIRVELTDLTEKDFIRILTEPKNSLIRQYTALMATDGITLDIKEDAIIKMAMMAFEANRRSQNIGARRLYTIVERLLEDISYEAPDCGEKTYTVDVALVEARLKDILASEDLAKYIL